MMPTSYPKRKHNRLRSWDYNQAGVYFLTICTHNRIPLFGRILENAVGAIHESPEKKCQLSLYGDIVEQSLVAVKERFSHMSVDKYVIMPNHVHVLVSITNRERAIRESPLRTNRSEISKFVGFFKSDVSRKIHKRCPVQKIWQRSYHDHIVRDEVDYQHIWNYIDTNPIRWQKDCFYVRTE